MNYKLMAEVLQLAVDSFLYDGKIGVYDGRCTWLCEAVGRAIKYKCLINFWSEKQEIEDDIAIAIDYEVFATAHLRKVYGWEWTADSEKIQAWRKQLAESLIAKYKEKAQ